MNKNDTNQPYVPCPPPPPSSSPTVDQMMVVIRRGCQSLNASSYRPNPNFNAFMAWPGGDQPSLGGW